jgi:peptidyl-prolyl cis-trans isomerase A (cyclophilin A)
MDIATALTLFSLVFTAPFEQAPAAAPSQLVMVVLETEKGAIEIEVDLGRAPVTAGNFLRYLDGGFYDGGRFTRTVRPDTENRTDYPIQVIQAMINPARRTEAFPAIALERTNATGILHKNGVISMARSNAADSATSQFFICLGDQPELDFGGKRNVDGQGFAAFGRVIIGMDVVEAIQKSPVAKSTQDPTALTQNLAPPVMIAKARRK